MQPDEPKHAPSVQQASPRKWPGIRALVGAIPMPRCNTRQLVAVLSVMLFSACVAAHRPASGVMQSSPQQEHRMAADADRQADPSAAQARLIDGLGSHVFPVTTDSSRAQQFINQGLNLDFAFNHAEAGRAFREAARLDPECAMAYWGQALVLGPNLNAPMLPEAEPGAFKLVHKALELSDHASAREQAYIEALAKRYTGDPADRQAADRAYADAMHTVMLRYPDDLDAAALWAEAKMDLRPWNYWMPDGTPSPGTPEIVTVLESVLARAPRHPMALHLYIHLMGPTDTLGRAEAAADRLVGLMPAAGHIVHMPGHIYERVGRYADAVAANQRAIAADETYIARYHPQGMYPMGYYPHNIAFLWMAASAEGNGGMAVAAARKAASKVPDAALAKMPMLGVLRVLPYYALTRFGRWDAMLAEPAPSTEDRFVTGIWHYARGLALVAAGHLDDADAELDLLREIADDASLDHPLMSRNTAAQVIAIAPPLLAGELAAARGDYDAAVARFTRAVRLHDGLAYTEPAEWHYPPRLALGAVLLEAGRPREAESVYWENLRNYPDNGWALYGLHQALLAQDKSQLAAAVNQRFKAAWTHADIELETSRIMPRPRVPSVATR